MEYLEIELTRGLDLRVTFAFLFLFLFLEEEVIFLIQERLLSDSNL